ncbi:hypothetical protein D3C77_743210 [compost metagenome]
MVGCSLIVNTLTDDTLSDTMVRSVWPRGMLHERENICTRKSEEDDQPCAAPRSLNPYLWYLVVGVGWCRGE